MKTKLLFTGLLLSLLCSQGNAQNYWALTYLGGSYNGGSIISMEPSNGVTTLHHSFQPPNGYHPFGSLLQANDGNLYGTCYDGGNFASCTIFRFNPTNDSYTDVHSFDIIHGDYPRSGLIQSSTGLLYGVATSGGTSGGSGGVLYTWNTATNFYTVIYNFNSATGNFPEGAPMFHSNGKIYGLTEVGGSGASGVIYSFDITTATYTVEYAFIPINGSLAMGSLIEATNGKLYGLTSDGGTNSLGVLFSFDPYSQVFTKLHDFAQAEGGQPSGSLVQAPNGILYGTASVGGANSGGTIFKYDLTSSTFTKMYDLTTINGTSPMGELMLQGNLLYGSAESGGTNNLGTLYSIDINTNAFTKLLDFDGTNGANPRGGFILVQPTGIPSVVAEGFHVYPNPASDLLTIEVPGGFASGSTFTISDLAGREVMQTQTTIPAGGNQLQMDVSQLKSGAYVVSIDSGKSISRYKFVRE